jgi:hypothetical protein
VFPTELRAALAARGYVTAGGNPYTASGVQAMLALSGRPLSNHASRSLRLSWMTRAPCRMVMAAFGQRSHAA